ncbi:MAG: GatB/YqeY domain-containing protein [Vicinamibacterales bacterium]|nr:GatB/YqeY domain-containing protein [Vicinamibacterales bacterium]
MDLLTRVNEAITSAMRTRDQAALGPLRMLKAALVNRRVELGREPTEDDALKVAASLAKQRRDSISQLERAGRTALVAQEKAEGERIVNAAIAETNANTPRDIGRVMKQVMTQVGGQSVDGSAVSALVKRKLSRER